MVHAFGKLLARSDEASERSKAQGDSPQSAHSNSIPREFSGQW
jgi:hypothetical protein